MPRCACHPARAQPRRDYYYQSRFGHRLFDLGLGPIALTFAAASSPEDQRAIDQMLIEERVGIAPVLSEPRLDLSEPSDPPSDDDGLNFCSAP